MKVHGLDPKCACCASGGCARRSPVPRPAKGVRFAEDEGLRAQVLDVLEPSATVEFALPGCDLRLLTLHVECLDAYMGIEVEASDHTGVLRRVAMNNNQSVVRVRGDECCMPLVLRPGWNMLCLDLDDIIFRAFGTHYTELHTVLIHACCRVWHLFAHDERVSDPELPKHLRVIQKDT